jgi:hypothetical protein
LQQPQQEELAFPIPEVAWQLQQQQVLRRMVFPILVEVW